MLQSSVIRKRAPLQAAAGNRAGDCRQRGRFERSVRKRILEHLNDPEWGAAQLAVELHMSLSTLKRRLAEGGLTFRSIRDSVIGELGCYLLSRTERRISDIAAELGYSELSAFDRAFSRITGQSPMSYRQMTRAAGDRDGIGQRLPRMVTTAAASSTPSRPPPFS